MEHRQTDGRLQRSERTRAAVVEAHASLLREGVVKPTAALIAERAGVSKRTLWSNFHDMETLLSSTVQHWFGLDDELRGEIDPSAPLDQRIADFCAERERRLVNISPAARAAVVGEQDHPGLREGRHGYIERVREEMEKIFAAELALAEDPVGLVDALTVASSWNAWSLLCDDHDYPADRCRQIMERTFHALLD